MATATGPLTKEALGVVILSVVVVLGLILLVAFKDASIGSDNTGLVNNEIDKFISGIGVFGDFIGIPCRVNFKRNS